MRTLAELSRTEVDRLLRSYVAGLVMLLLLVFHAGTVDAGPRIVDEGQPNAEIVIPVDRPRMVALAALELQYYLEKISGATLPITTEPSGEAAVAIYVGNSPRTEALGVTDAGLKYGAYRIVSGDNWLALLGSDFDYAPPEPWARSNGDTPRARADWDEITKDLTDTAWGYPFGALRKTHWEGRGRGEMAQRYGEENAQWWPSGNFNTGFWSNDEGGSLNAVYGWLETLGARWYMPGELGEVIPARETLPLASFDLTVEPDFALRSWFWYNYSIFPFADVLWARQLGHNGGAEVLGGGQYGYAHGHTRVHSRDEMQEKHPEYYALRGGERDTHHRGHGTACYSSEGLEQETIAYARFMFDHYDWPKFSVWPGDGFRQCQCEQCAGKTPSDLVWGFTERVARELYKSHPDRLVVCGAYTSYAMPPESIAKFSPNVTVIMANRGRPALTVPAYWDAYQQELRGWLDRLAPNRLIRGDNNRYHMGKTVSFPVIQATATAKDLQMLKGISIGEISEQSQRRELLNPGANHLGLYTQARYLWDAEQDLDALLDDYFTRFYGPARDDMRTAFAFAEEAYARAVATAAGRGRNVPTEDRIRYVKLLQAARKTAGESVYGQRVQLLLDELATVEALEARLAEEAEVGDVRKDAPVALARHAGSPADQATYTLGAIEDGAAPEVETTFTVTWDEDALIFEIRCEDPDMANLAISPQVWDGDSVAILLETPTHAYYQIEINPDGAIYDADRGGPVRARWKSLAEVETKRMPDAWRVTARIPVVSPDEGHSDPYHNVAGVKPSAAHPWFFQVGRVRMRGTGQEVKSAYTFSPTGTGTYHVPERFGKLIME